MKRESNADMGPKDFFEMTSNIFRCRLCTKSPEIIQNFRALNQNKRVPCQSLRTTFRYSRTCLKIRILVPGQGGADFQTADAPKEVLLECNLLVVVDLKKAPTPISGEKTFLR
jgi:hypothetical protein